LTQNSGEAAPDDDRFNGMESRFDGRFNPTFATQSGAQPTWRDMLFAAPRSKMTWSGPGASLADV
jgi:hypothetical protein